VHLITQKEQEEERFYAEEMVSKPLEKVRHVTKDIVRVSRASEQCCETDMRAELCIVYQLLVLPCVELIFVVHRTEAWYPLLRHTIEKLLL